MQKYLPILYVLNVCTYEVVCGDNDNDDSTCLMPSLCHAKFHLLHFMNADSARRLLTLTLRPSQATWGLSSLVSCYHLNSLSQFVINTWPEIYHWLCCNSWNATCYLYISLLKWHLQPVYLWPFFCFWNSVSNNLLLVKLWYCRTPLDLWKHAYISRFPQKVSWCFVIQNNKYLYY